jgi:hypothetical protein
MNQPLKVKALMQEVSVKKVFNRKVRKEKPQRTQKDEHLTAMNG